MAGDIYYSCGHKVHSHDMPTDQDWQSEVPCDECREDTREAEMELL